MNMLPPHYRPLMAVLLFSLCLVWVGCDTEQDPIEDPPFFELNAEGDVVEGISGQNAIFATYVDAETGVDVLFIQLITDEASPRGVALAGRADDVPAEDFYEIVELEADLEVMLEEFEDGQMIAEYVTISPDDEISQVSYTSMSGDLQITHSTDTRLEGTLSFVAHLDEGNGENEDPREIVVSGSFEAQRAEVNQ